jgi:hypothetical protein
MENKEKEYIIFISVNDGKILMFSVDLLLLFSQTLHLKKAFLLTFLRTINSRSRSLLIFQKVKSSVGGQTKKTVVISKNLAKVCFFHYRGMLLVCLSMLIISKIFYFFFIPAQVQITIADLVA